MDEIVKDAKKNKRTCHIIFCGHFLALAAEKEDIVWKSAMYNLKKGTLKFLLNASDTPPTAANHIRWKKLDQTCSSCASDAKSLSTFLVHAR